MPSLVGLMQKLDRREVRVVDVATHPAVAVRPQSLLFGYVAAFVYEGDSPIAERRAAALALDQGLLAELLGRAELRELLDPEVLAEVEAELQRLAQDRRARDAEGVADLLRLLGPLTTAQVAERCVPDGDAAAWLTGLADARRAVGSGSPASDTGSPSRTSPGCATRSACRCRPASPTRSPSRSTTRWATWSRRYARTHGPFTTADVAARFGLGVAWSPADACAAGRRRAGCSRASSGPAGAGSEWCDAEVLRTLRRRSLARLRKEVEPVEPAALGRFLPAVAARHRRQPRPPRGRRGAVRRSSSWPAAPVPASALEPLVLAARVSDYQPAMLDELTAVR